jgi:predicted kinase
VEQITLLNQSIKIDTAKNAGLCDTCYASVKSVVIENRIGVNKASEQNYDIAQLIASNELEIERLAIINATLIKLRKKYELNYSMYFDRNLRMDKERILSIDSDLKRKLKQ